MSTDFDQRAIDEICQAAVTMRRLLLDSRNPQGWWTGCLSTSALSTATATMALHLASKAVPTDAGRKTYRALVERGLRWLAQHQNEDGGWGDTVLSTSNISTSMLTDAVFRAVQRQSSEDSDGQFRQLLRRSAAYIERAGGVDAVLKRYGRDHTFSVPILTHCALAGVVDWKQIIPLPFELACVPAAFYSAVRMPVVSYALPALIAIGQVIFRHQGHWNPVVRLLRRAAVRPTLKVLESIQPPNGGFLEATPLTSFVCMSLLGCGLYSHPVTRRCLNFLCESVREDGSWPIDTNLTTWVSTLSVNALSESDNSLPESTGTPTNEETVVDNGSEVKEAAEWPVLSDAEIRIIRTWLLNQQYRSVHPYTRAAPGGWSWTDLPGGVPDADDTPGAILALLNLIPETEAACDREQRALRDAVSWLLNLQNADGGWPTFCRGWGTLPFDRSSSDLTAHVVRAVQRWQDRFGHLEAGISKRAEAAMRRGVQFLLKCQRSDGSWLPLWFGNQFHENDLNPLYGTAKVLRALECAGRCAGTGSSQAEHQSVMRGISWLLSQQNDDGGWSAQRGLKSSVEETGLAVEALAAPDFVEIDGVVAAAHRGAVWLAARVKEGTVSEPAPIGFYFAKLWYFEALYPIIFATSGLNRWMQTNCKR